MNHAVDNPEKHWDAVSVGSQDSTDSVHSEAIPCVVQRLSSAPSSRDEILTSRSQVDA